MSSKYDEILQKVKGGYVPSQPQTSAYDRAMQGVKEGKYTFGVDEQYISSFIDDYNSYANVLKQKAASASFSDFKDISFLNDGKGVDLSERASKIRSFLEVQKNNIGSDAYEKLSTTVNTALNDIDEYYSFFKSANTSVADFNTEEEYNQAVETQKKLSYDASWMTANTFITPKSIVEINDKIDNLKRTSPQGSVKVGNETATLEKQRDSMVKQLGFNSYDDFKKEFDYAQEALNLQFENRYAQEFSKDPDADKYVKAGQEIGWNARDRQYMTANENQILDYINGKYGAEAALRYYNELEKSLSYREWQGKSADFIKFAEAHPGWAGVVNLGLTIPKAVVSFGANIENFVNSNSSTYAYYRKQGDVIDAYSGANGVLQTLNAVHQEVSSQLAKGSKVDKVVYDITYGIVDNVSRMAVGTAVAVMTGGNPVTVVPLVSSFLVANTGLADGVIDAKGRGLSDKEAFAYGIASASAEAATEYISDRIFMGADGGVITKLLLNSLAEGVGEGSSNLLTLVADCAIAGDKSHFAAAVQEYIDKGKNGEEAFKLALTDALKDAGYDALIGAITGFIMSGGQSAIEFAMNKSTQDKNTKGLNFSNLSKAIKKTDGAAEYLEFAKSLGDAELTKELEGATANKISYALINKTLPRVRQNIYDTLSKASNLQEFSEQIELLSRNVKSESIKQVITSAALEVAFAHPEWNTNTNVSGNNIDTDVENGYNDERGGNSADFEQGRNRENSEEIAGAVNSGGESQSETTRGANEESDFRRVLGDAAQGRPGERVHVSAGNQKISFVLKEVDNSVAGNAVRILNNMGIEAVLCDGEIIAENGSHPTYSQALTLPNGVVYVSSNATLSDVEIAAHESVHVHEIEQTNDYKTYHTVVCDNINWDSEGYKSVAEWLNNTHYNGKYDIYSDKFSKLFIREISAYVNQSVTTNLEFAEYKFSEAFRDWNAVVEASRQFNKDIGADFSESASFMPENSEEGDSESVLPDMSAAAPEADAIKDDAYAARGLERLTDEQRQIKAIGKALGREVEFKNLDRWRKDKNGNRKFFSPDGYYDKATGKIYINTSQKVKHNPLGFVFKHELTHFAETNKAAYDNFVAAVKKSKEFEAWLRSKTGVSDGSVDAMTAKLNEDIREQRSKYGIELGVAEGEKEVIANFVGDILFQKSGKTLDSLLNNVEAKQKPKVIQFVLDFVHWLREKLSGNKELTFELQRLESKYEALLKESQKAFEQKTARETKNSTDEGGEVYSFKGYAEDGKGKYESNFTKGTPKAAKAKKILHYIQNVWSKKPIRLKIIENGETRYIEAKFDPTYHTEEGKRTDASKLMGGNRHGSSAEQRVTLDLADDYYQIASESQYNYSKDETGKDNPTHKGVIKWHYFINDIYFAEYGSKDYEPYRVSINVKERSDGEYVYSFSAEKQRESNTPRTLHAVVNDGESSNANVQLSDNRVAHNEPSVNNYSMQDSKEYSMPSEADTDYTAEMNALDEQFKNGEIDRDQYISRINELYKKAGDEYGTIPKGEEVTGNEDFDNPVPQSVEGKKKVRRHVRTIIEGGELTEEMLNVTKQQILSGNFSYTPTSNEANIKYAERAIESGRAESMWQMAANGEEKPNANSVAVGEMLLKLAVERKDTAKVVQLTAELSEMATRLGQATQAFSLLKRMDGIGQLYYVQKTVDRLNQDLQKKHGDKAPIITVNEGLAQQLAESKTKADFDISYNAIMNDIAQQVPATFLDKWNAWRYMSMLFNPTTHVRNVIGNAVFCPAIKLKDTISAGLEKAFIKEENRTKSVIVKKEYKDFAKADFDEVRDIITGGGKMNPQTSIAENKRIFKNKVLENARKFNFDMLEKEDAIFLKGHYERALGGYLQARNINLKTVSPDVLAKAREYAIIEAQKATYRDASAFANAVSNFANKNTISNVLVEGILPFKKTPINIVKRGIEYSPIGLFKTLSKGTYDLQKGNITASQYIDGIAGGLTGTGVVALGMLLSSLGFVKGGFGDEEEDWFDKMLGMQEYSVEIGGKSYTIDWAAPVCMPFFMGVSVMETLQSEGNENFFSAITNSLGAGLEPFINLSMLSGIQDTIAAARYSEADEIIQSVALNIVDSYFSQMIPTIGGKINNVIDPARRSNYIDKTSPIPPFVQSALNTLYSKTPFLSKYKAEYVDAWGQKQTKGNFAERFFQSFLSPGYLSDVEVTEVDAELKRIAKETGESSVFPDNAPKYVKFKNTTKHLTADEYTDYAVKKGEMSAQYIEELINSPYYAKLTDEQKVDVINDLYQFANAKAKAGMQYTYEEINAMHNGAISEDKYNSYSDKTKKALVEEYFFDKYKKVYNTERNGGSAVDYYIKNAMKK